MTFSTFNILPQGLQADVLLNSGVYLDLARETSKLNIELYALHEFYVEVYLDKITEDLVLLRAFESLRDLERYFHLIAINSIL